MVMMMLIMLVLIMVGCDYADVVPSTVIDILYTAN
jgi:hypothetical protein